MKPPPWQPPERRSGGVPTLYKSPGRARRTKLAARAQALGYSTTPVDPTPITARIHELYGYGMTDCMIAAAAGCSDSIVRLIGKSHYSLTIRRIANQIMAVTPTPHPRQRLCLAIGAQRRIRALRALGWRLEDMSQHVGRTNSNLIGQVLYRNHIKYKTWLLVHQIYDDLSGTRGPSELTATRARLAGDPPPLAWDGIDIDDPAAQPDWTAAGIKQSERPVCPNGHTYTAENTARDSHGRRQCRTCRRAAVARRKARQTERTGVAA